MGLGTYIDHAIAVFAPQRAVRRMHARRQYAQLATFEAARKNLTLASA